MTEILLFNQVSVIEPEAKMGMAKIVGPVSFSAIFAYLMSLSRTSWEPTWLRRLLLIHTPLPVMFRHMLRVRHNLQVFYFIVQTVSVYMVYYFFWPRFKRTTKIFFDNITMLKDSFSLYCKFLISSLNSTFTIMRQLSSAVTPKTFVVHITQLKVFYFNFSIAIDNFTDHSLIMTERLRRVN